MTARRLELLRIPLRALWRTSLIWGISLGSLIAATVAFWPAFKGSSRT